MTDDGGTRNFQKKIFINNLDFELVIVLFSIKTKVVIHTLYGVLKVW